jgi:hypothetical protein
MLVMAFLIVNDSRIDMLKYGLDTVHIIYVVLI